MMKKALFGGLTLAMMMSLTTAAFADTAPGGNPDESKITESANVQARIIEDDTVSANVTWDEMKLYFQEKENKWVCPRNGVEVTNTSPHRTIQTSYSFTKADGVNSDFGIALSSKFADSREFVIGAPVPASFSSLSEGAVVTGDPVAPSGAEERYVVFTASPLEKPGSLTTDFTTIGTFLLKIDAVK